MKTIWMVLVVACLPGSGFAQTVEWDVSLWGKRRAFTEHVERLAELVSEKTAGDFQLKLSYGDLSKPRENLDGIAQGRFEMAQFCAGYHAEKNPAITVLELPYLGVETLRQERTVSQYLYRHPAVMKDFARWNAVALMPSPLPQYNLVGTGETPASLEDLSGLQVRATGGIGKAMEALNAFPVSLTANEVSEALEGGEISAVAFAPHAHLSFGTMSSARWWTTNLNPGTVNCPVVANVDAVRELSTEHREALYGSINQALDHYIDNYEYNMDRAWIPALQILGIESVNFNETEIADFTGKVSKSAALEWISANEAIGVPAVDLYRYVKIAIAGVNPEEFLEQESAMEMAKVKAEEAKKALQVSSEQELEQQRVEAVLSAYTFDQSPENKVERIVGAHDIEKVIAEATGVTENEDVLVTQEDLPIASTDPVDELNNSEATEQFIPVASLDQGYFGTPRSGKAKSIDARPTEMLVEWVYTDDVTVGEALSDLASYIGYTLVSNNDFVKSVYSRDLPTSQRQVAEIAVGAGFQALAGSGLMTMFDHPSRTVTHAPIVDEKTTEALPPCPDSIVLAEGTADGALLLPDGTECDYRGHG